MTTASPAIAVKAIAAQISQAISLDEYSDLHEVSQLLERLDIGSALICKVLHPVNGLLSLINTSAGDCAMILLG